MDAHDEFFSVWCEPALEKIVTFVRAWDPQTQDHIVLCRRCSKEHIKALGQQEPEYVQTVPAVPDASQKQRYKDRLYQWWQYLRRWGATLLGLLIDAWRRPKGVQDSTTTKPYSHSGT
jgi:hypothetical protein